MNGGVVEAFVFERDWSEKMDVTACLSRGVEFGVGIWNRGRSGVFAIKLLIRGSYA